MYFKTAFFFFVFLDANLNEISFTILFPFGLQDFIAKRTPKSKLTLNNCTIKNEICHWITFIYTQLSFHVEAHDSCPQLQVIFFYFFFFLKKTILIRVKYVLCPISFKIFFFFFFFSPNSSFRIVDDTSFMVKDRDGTSI
jgi:hypothetical protein